MLPLLPRVRVALGLAGALWRRLPLVTRRRPDGRLTWPARLARVALALAALLGAALGGAKGAAPWILRGPVARGLGVEIEAGSVEVSYLAGTARIRDVVVRKSLAPGEPPEPILEAPLVAGEFELRHLLHGELRIRSIVAVEPHLRFEIGDDGKSTVDRVVATSPWLRPKDRPRPREPGGGGLEVALEELRLEGVRVDFQDLAAEPTLLVQATADARFEAPGRFVVTVAVDGLARAVRIAGEVGKGAARGVHVSVGATGDGLSLAVLEDYLPPAIATRVVDGRVELEAEATLAPAESGIALEARVARLRIEDRGASLASLDGLEVDAPRLDGRAGVFHVARARLGALSAAVERDAAGVVHVGGFAFGGLGAPRAADDAAPALERTYRALAEVSRVGEEPAEAAAERRAEAAVEREAEKARRTEGAAEGRAEQRAAVLARRAKARAEREAAALRRAAEVERAEAARAASATAQMGAGAEARSATEAAISLARGATPSALDASGDDAFIDEALSAATPTAVELAAATASARPLPDIRVDDVEVGSVAIAWRDAAVAPALETALRLPRLRVAGFRFPEVPEAATFDLALSLDGIVRALSISGSAVPFGGRREATLALRLEGLDATRLAPYAPPGLAPTLRDGRLEVAVDAKLDDLGGGRYAADASVGQTVLLEGGEPVAALGGARVVAPLIDIARREVVVRDALVETPTACVERLADGRIEVAGLALGAAAPTGTAAGAPVLGSLPARAGGAKAAPGLPLRVSVARARVRDARADLRDDAVTPPFAATVEVRAIGLRALELPDPTTAVAFWVDAGAPGIVGRATLEGLVEPLGAERRLEVGVRVEHASTAPLERLRPPGWPALRLADGSASADVVARLVEAEPGVFRGTASLSRIALADGATRLASLDELKAAIARFAPPRPGAPAAGGAPPWTLELDSLEAIAPEFLLERDEKGFVRALGVVSRAPVDALRSGAPKRPPDAPRPSRPPPRAMPELPLVAAKRVRVTGGRATVVDRAVEPATTVRVTSLEATARGFSTAGLRGGPPPPVAFSATVAAEGVLEQARADGVVKLAPLPEATFGVRVRGLDLRALSPFVYAASKVLLKAGTGALESDVALGRTTLDARNRIVVSGLELGGEGLTAQRLPGAVPVPLEVAVTMLRDDRGVIDIEVPFSGDRDAPSTDLVELFGTALGQAMANSLKKLGNIFTRPFSSAPKPREALRFDPIPFAPAEAAVSRDGLAPIERAAQALEKHPGVTIELRGAADPASDIPAELLAAATLEHGELEQASATARPLAALVEQRAALATGPEGEDRIVVGDGKAKLTGKLLGERDGKLAILTRWAPPIEVDEAGIAWVYVGTEAGRGLLARADGLEGIVARQLARLAELDQEIAAVRAELERVRGLNRRELDDVQRRARDEAREKLRALALARARAVRDALVKRGIRDSRVLVAEPSESALEPPRPHAPGEEGRFGAEKRSVEVVVPTG